MRFEGINRAAAGANCTTTYLVTFFPREIKKMLKCLMVEISHIN